MTSQALGGISQLDLLPFTAKRLESCSTCMMDLLRSDAPILLYRMVMPSLLIGRYLVLLLQHHHDNPYAVPTSTPSVQLGQLGQLEQLEQATGATGASSWTNWSTEAIRTRLNRTNWSARSEQLE